MSDTGDVLYFASRIEWRSWLESHHASASEARFAIYKKDSRTPLLTLSEAQQEALCFGWVDTTAGRIDDSSYMLRLTPRRPGSAWSMSNVRRVENLAAQGLMTEAGWKTVAEAKANGQWDLALRVEETDLVPPALEKASRTRPGLVEAYLGLAPSRRRQMLRSVLSAKGETSRDRRIQNLIKELD